MVEMYIYISFFFRAGVGKGGIHTGGDVATAVYMGTRDWACWTCDTHRLGLEPTHWWILTLGRDRKRVLGLSHQLHGWVFCP